MLSSTVERVDCTVAEQYNVAEHTARRIHSFNGGEANCLASPRILVRPPCRTVEGKILCIPRPIAQLVEQWGKLGRINGDRRHNGKLAGDAQKTLWPKPPLSKAEPNFVRGIEVIVCDKRKLSGR